MSAESTTPAEVRAYEFAIEQIWEVCLGLKDAYQAATGQDMEWQIPAWKDLAPQQKLAWSRRVGPLLQDLPLLATRITDPGWAQS